MLQAILHKLGLKRCPACETLVDYAMEGLDGRRREDVRRHLEECPPCREQVRDFWQVNEALGLSAEEASPPAGFESRVLGRLSEAAPAPAPARPAPFGWALFWMRLGPLFALLSLLMSLVALAALLARPAARPAGEAEALAQGYFGAPAAARVELAGAPGAGRGLLLLGPGRDRLLLRCEGLDPRASAGAWTLEARAPGQAPRRLAAVAAQPGYQLLSLSPPLPAGSLDFGLAPPAGAGLRGSLRP